MSLRRRCAPLGSVQPPEKLPQSTPWKVGARRGGAASGTHPQRPTPLAEPPRPVETLQAQPEPTGLPALVARSGLHANTVREHLAGLERSGLLVRTAAAPVGRGRPGWLYAATGRATDDPGSEYAGLAATLGQAPADHEQHDHDYRETVSPWFGSIFRLNPDIDAMAAAPVQFHVHVLVGMLLFAAWPFTRLVHAFTAPVRYLFRPYIVYGSRDARTPAPTGRPRAGWSPVGTSDRDRSA